MANIWATSTSLGPYGWILAAVATAAMFGSFLSSKTKAKEATQYSEGGYLEVGGGSHASGNDTTFAVVNGREHKAERGEAHAIFTGRATSKYGDLIPNMVDATNALQLENMISVPSEATQTLDYTGILKSGVRATENLASAMTRSREVVSSSTYIDKRGRTISETRKNGIITHTKIVE